MTQVSSFLYSYGADFQDPSGKASLNTDAAIKGFQTYGDLLRNYGPPGVTNMGWIEASALFAQGKAGFYVDADSQAYTFLDKTKSNVVDTVSYTMFPAGSAGAHPYNIVPQTVGINAFSKKQAAAWDFIKWITNVENTKWMLSDKTAPVARDSAWNDPVASAKFPKELVDVIKQCSVPKVCIGHDRPQLEAVAKARDIVGGIVVAAIQGEDVKAAATKANTDFQALLNTEKK